MIVTHQIFFFKQFFSAISTSTGNPNPGRVTGLENQVRFVTIVV